MVAVADDPAQQQRPPLRKEVRKEQAPAYVTYPYVLRGYRTGGSYSQNFWQGLTELHAETLNAWTMIAGVAGSLCYLHWTLTSYSLTWQQALPFCILSLSTAIHMPFSVGFHIFRGMDAEVYNLWRRLDQVFIFQVSTLIAFSTAYFVVPLWACLAWTGVSVAVAGYGSHVIWSLPPHVQRDRRAVVALVSAVVFCYTAPIALQAALDLASGRVDTVVVLCAAGVAASLTSGGAVFAAGIPEKWFPNVFDYVGSSHQLMHLGALAAHAFEYLFLWEMLERRMAGPGGEVRAGSSLVASAAAGLWAAAGAGAGAAVAWRPAEGQQSASWPSLLAALVGGDGKEL